MITKMPRKQSQPYAAILLAGTPKTLWTSGTSETTAAPEPTTAPSPTFILGKITECGWSVTSSPITAPPPMNTEALIWQQRPIFTSCPIVTCAAIMVSDPAATRRQLLCDGKQHRFLCMDRKVPQVKAVAEAKTIEKLRDLPKIFEVVVNRYRQLGFELP
jgi:hypothetical protein